MKNNKVMNSSKKNKTHTDKHGKRYFEERLVDEKLGILSIRQTNVH